MKFLQEDLLQSCQQHLQKFNLANKWALNFVTTGDWYNGSGKISRFGAWPLRDMVQRSPCCYSGFRALGAVLRSTLTPTLNTDGVERSPADMITNAGKVFDTATANQHN